MARKQLNYLPPSPGWAIYLRTSNREAQNPKMSQERQRFNIRRTLLERSDLLLIDEYADVESGTKADREEYQRMLHDARMGKFSHVAVENAERFGRNDAEALSIIDELHSLGIAIRFADYPDLDPIDPDDRIMVSLSFTLARRESIKLGERVKGGLHTKMRSGGWAGKAPDGYINQEERTAGIEKSQSGRYTRWIEQDPEQTIVWQHAWQLLLEDQWTLEEICEKLHVRGYRFRTGRPFIKVNKNGTRSSAKNSLSRIFHNWFYAGWVVSNKAGIPPKTVRGQWKQIVTTEQFERGLEILKKRMRNKAPRHRHIYLLSGLIYCDCPQLGKQLRMTGSTPNSGRESGGISYYRIERHNVRLVCRMVDANVAKELLKVQIVPDMIPIIREYYTQELADNLGTLRPQERETLELALKSIEQEEERVVRLFAAGKISRTVWDNMWQEWQDRRRSIQVTIDNLDCHTDRHITHLDTALAIIAKVGILYSSLERSDQKLLLKEMIERVIVDPEGKIVEVKWLPPFAYLHDISGKVNQADDPQAMESKTGTSKTGSCSRSVLVSGRYRTRTCDLSDVNRALLTI
jgi:DNA invertase Pin-like site-specific DNA recombinase